MSTQHTPKPLTQREQRTLGRLQIKWSKKTITAEEKAYALALSNRAGQAETSAEHSLLLDAAALLASFVEDGVPIQRSAARDMLGRLRLARCCC